MDASDDDNPRLIELGKDYLEALRHAIEIALSTSVFLSSFPPASAEGNREILLRLRQNLVEALERGYGPVFDVFLKNCDIASQFKELDRSMLNEAALSGAMSDISDETSLETIAKRCPFDQLAQARLSCKKAEAARLEKLVEEKESTTSSLTAQVLQMAEEFRAGQADVGVQVEIFRKSARTLAQV